MRYMRLLYICPLPKAEQLHSEWHGLDLKNGLWLICVRWQDEGEELMFSQDPEVRPLPHPIFDMDEPLGDHHLEPLKLVFPQIQKGHNVHDLMKEAGRIGPLFRPRVF